MPFNTLLLISLIPETRFSESGVEVSINQQAGEEILFFDMDQPPVRQSLNIQGKICDGMVFYLRNDERTICFVELKSSNLDDAVHQVISTYKQMKDVLEQSLRRLSSQSQLQTV